MGVFGCIVPGLPATYQIQQVSEGRWLLELGTLKSDQIVAFLTGLQPCPPGKGVGVYLSRSQQQSFEYVGHLTNECPTGIFTVPVSLVEVAATSPLCLGLCLEALETLSNLEAAGTLAQQAVQKQLTHAEVARKLASDCSNFLGSFSKTDPASGQDFLLAPQECLSKWLQKVVSRLQRDPGWWTKN